MATEEPGGLDPRPAVEANRQARHALEQAVREVVQPVVAPLLAEAEEGYRRAKAEREKLAGR